MSANRLVWLLLNAETSAGALLMLGFGLFDVGVHTPSNELVFSFCAPVFLSWLLYFGSRT